MSTEMTEKPASIPIPKPRTNRAHFMGLDTIAAEPVVENMLADNTATRSQDLNFKTTDEFHRAFKTVALHMGISMKGLLDEAFALYVARHGLADIVREARAGVLQTRQRGKLEKQAQAQRERRARKKTEQFEG